MDIMEGLELRHLRYFLAVAEELHFSRAAQRLGIAQPPLSQQIRRLERRLDVRLFDRSNRRVALTAAGEAFLPEVRRILSSTAEATEIARKAARGESGTVTVAFAASVMFRTLPSIIRRFRARYPEVRVELRELPTGLQLAGLASGQIDVGFLREPPEEPSVTSETVMTEPLVIAVATSHPLAAGETIRVSDLVDEDFVLFPGEVAPGLHAQILSLCGREGFSPRVAQEAREIYTTVSLVEAGVGVTIVPGSIRKMGWSGVAYREIPAPAGLTRIDMAWRKDDDRPVVASFLSMVRDLVEEGLAGEFD